MAEEITTTSDPLDAGSNPAPGLPARAGEHSVKQKISSAEAPDATSVGEDAGARALHDDMARILEEVKLPERRNFTASGDAVRKNQELADVPTLQTMPLQKEAPPFTAPLQNSYNQADDTKKGTPSASTPPIHTLKDDLQEVVRDKKISLVRAVALEEEKKRGQKETSGGTRKEGRRGAAGIILGAFALLLLVSGAIYGVYFLTQKPPPAGGASADTPLFFADNTVPFPMGTLSGADLKRTLALGLNVPRASLGAIMRIMPTVSYTDANGVQAERAATIGEFLKAAGAQAAPDLVRAFRGDFFLGVHAVTDRNVPVLAIPVTSYDRAFAGLLAWEATMNDDLAPLFSPVPALMVDEAGLLVERKFEDGVMQNYDVRFLKDDTGAVKLLYSFPTRNMLVIMESPYSLSEVLGRLRAARQL